jgi:hypothetical protein
MIYAITLTTYSFRNTGGPNIFDGIAWFHQNKCCFVAYDKLFLEQSLGTHFHQFKFPRVRPIVL